MRILPTALLTAIAAPLSAQMSITEVLIDPVGPNAGAQIVEITNTSGAPFSPIGWFICSQPHYAPLPTLQIPVDGVIQLHLNASGQNTSTDWFFPTMPELPLISAFQLYQSPSFHVDTDIIDHVSWGGSGPRAGQAANIGQWPSAGAFVPVPAAEGHTISYDGTGDAHTDWYTDASPTLGALNETAVITTVGTGCPTSGLIPTLTIPSPAVDGNLDFQIQLAGFTGATATAGVFLGSAIPGGVPLLGCNLYVNPFATITGITDPAGNLGITLPLIGASPVTGLTLSLQGAVLDAGAPNGLFGLSANTNFTIGV